MRTGFKPVDHRYDDALSRVSWDTFERLVAEHYRSLGYEVTHTGTGGGTNRTDGGIDLRLRRDEETAVVQCKHWNCWQVPHNDVHQLIGVMHTSGATRAIVITSGEFTRAALEAAKKFPHVRLIDGKMVRTMLGPVEEPTMPHATMDAMPSWTRHARGPRRTGLNRGPVVAAIGAFVTLAVAVVMLYGYYDREIHHAQLAAVRTALSRIDRTAHPIRPAPIFPPRTSNQPMSTINGRPAVVHDAPMTKADIAEWEKKNAESMRILEKTTPSLP